MWIKIQNTYTQAGKRNAKNLQREHTMVETRGTDTRDRFLYVYVARAFAITQYRVNFCSLYMRSDAHTSTKDPLNSNFNFQIEFINCLYMLHQAIEAKMHPVTRLRVYVNIYVCVVYAYACVYAYLSCVQQRTWSLRETRHTLTFTHDNTYTFYGN